MSRSRNKISLPGRSIRKPNTYQPINISRPKSYMPKKNKKPEPGDFILGETELL